MFILRIYLLLNVMYICRYVCCGCLTIACMIRMRLLLMLLCLLYAMFYICLSECVIVVGYLVKDGRPKPLTCGRDGELTTY